MRGSKAPEPVTQDRVTTNANGMRVRETNDYRQESKPGETLRFVERPREPITIRTPHERGSEPAKAPFDQTKPQYWRPDRAFFMPGDDTVPVSFTKNKRGEDVPVKVPYDIVHSPLIAGKQPDADLLKNAVDRLPKNQYKYLTDAARRRLSALDEASANYYLREQDCG